MPVINTSVTPRPDLLGAFHEFDPAQQGFVASRVLPVFTVGADAGRGGIVPIEAFTTKQMDIIRAPNAPVSRGDYSLDLFNFSLREYAFEHVIDRQVQSLYETWLDSEEASTRICAHQIEMQYEAAVAAMCLNDTTFPADDESGHQADAPWSDKADGDPIRDTQLAINAIRRRTGSTAVSMVVDYALHQDLSVHPVIRNRLSVNVDQPGLLPPDALARTLGLRSVIVASSVANITPPGSGDGPEMAAAWDPDQAFYFIEGGGGLELPQLGRTFARRETTEIESWESRNPPGRVVSAWKKIEPLILYPGAGYRVEALSA